MNTQEIRLSILNILNNTHDEDLLNTYYALLKTMMEFRGRQVAGYDSQGNPITAESLEQQAAAAKERFKNGDYIRHEDLMKEIENW